MAEKNAAVIASRDGSLIPDEIREEILARLPAGDVTRFKIVCKAWRDLISCPRFIRFHLEKSLSTNIRHRLASINHLREKNSVELLVWKIDKAGIATIEKRSEQAAVTDYFSQSPYVVGSCDGLICYIDVEFCGSLQRMVITICNPTTGESQKRHTEIFLRQVRVLCYGFGRSKVTRDSCKDDINIGDYKLVLGTAPFGSVRFITMHTIRPFIESSKWKPSSRVRLKRYENTMEEEKGRVIVNQRVLLAYDLEPGALLEVCGLPGKPHCPLTLGVVDGCLIALRCEFFRWELWVMKEYGVEQSWSKRMALPESLPAAYYNELNLWLNLLWVCEDGDYIFGTGGNNRRRFRLLKTGENKQHTVFYKHLHGYNNVQLIPFVETLFSPPPMNATESTSSYDII